MVKKVLVVILCLLLGYWGGNTYKLAQSLAQVTYTAGYRACVNDVNEQLRR